MSLRASVVMRPGTSRAHLPRMLRKTLLGSFCVVLGLIGCSSQASEDDVNEANATAGDGKVCVALRGNGHYIITHFNGLARIHELYGKVDTLAGGSSFA